MGDQTTPTLGPEQQPAPEIDAAALLLVYRIYVMARRAAALTFIVVLVLLAWSASRAFSGRPHSGTVVVAEVLICLVLVTGVNVLTALGIARPLAGATGRRDGCARSIILYTVVLAPFSAGIAGLFLLQAMASEAMEAQGLRRTLFGVRKCDVVEFVARLASVQQADASPSGSPPQP